MRASVWLFLAAVFGAAAGAPPAAAQDHEICVSAQAPTVVGRCPRCDGPPLASFAEAFEVAAALPDVGGVRPSVAICIETSGPHVETLVVNNAGGRVGAPLTLAMEGARLCPDPGTPTDAPLVRWTPSEPVGGITDALVGLESLMSSEGCAAARPGIEATGAGRLSVVAPRLAGTVGFAVAAGLAGSAEIALSDGSLLDARGAAIRSGSYIGVARTEIVGAWLDAASPAPGVVAATATGFVALRASVVHGNAVDAGAVPGAAILVGQIVLDGTTVSGNAVAGGPLGRLAYGGRGFATLDGELMGSFVLRNSVFARNRRVDALGLQPSGSAHRSLPGEFALACAGDGQPPLRALPGVGEDAAIASGPLLTVEPGLGLAERADFVVGRTFFVDNAVGSGPVIAVDADGALLTTQLLHATFGGNVDAPALTVAGTRPDGEVHVLACLMADGPAAAVRVDGAPRTVTFTGNHGPDGLGVDGAEAARYSLVGGNGGLPARPFLDVDEIETLDACGRFQVACPAADVACAGWRGGELPCAPDAAAAYVPDPAWAQEGSLWPWDTAFFRAGTGTSWSLPGATGWGCAPPRGTADQTLVDGDPAWGDGDGFPDAVDCDNADRDSVPLLPAQDGQRGTPCAAPQAGCYVCPPDSAELPPGVCDPDDPNCVTYGCVGCGAPLIRREVFVSALLAAPFGLRLARRRRPRC